VCLDSRHVLIDIEEHNLSLFPVLRLPVLRLPAHRLPVLRLPVHRLPVHRLPVHRHRRWGYGHPLNANNERDNTLTRCSIDSV